MSNWYAIAKYSNKVKNEGDLGFLRDWADIRVNVENQAGTIRMGVDPDGHEWRVTMKYDYGFVNSLKGEDGEGIDVYLGANQKETKVFVVHQVVPSTGEYDEDKVMLGFPSKSEAKKAYLSHYDTPKVFGDITEITLSDFKRSIRDNDIDVFRWKKPTKKKKKSQ